VKALLFLLCFQVQAEPFKATPMEIYDKISTLLVPDYKPRPKADSTWYLVGFPTDKPRPGSNDIEWADSTLLIISGENGMAKQIALESYGCGIRGEEKEKEKEPEIRARFEELVKSFTKQLWGKEFSVNPRYFKEFPSDRHVWRRVPVTEPFEPVKSMRISRGLYKCDARGGFGYRFDFFLHPVAAAAEQ